MALRYLPLIIVGAACAAGLAWAQQPGGRGDAGALALAKKQAQEALARSQTLDRESREATNDAARARAESSALAARIEASEADITAAETRVRIVERLRARQRARLAEKQEPVVRLMAALETMGRRPPALALVQPGSLDDLVRVRALLASTLPVVRARTAALREEVEAGNRLRAQAERAVAALRTSREELRTRRIALARFEVEQQRRSRSLAESALFESDRALALGEEARELSAAYGTRQYQEQLRRRLIELPGPLPRPAPVEAEGAPALRYRIPVDGRLITGTGEISDSGVHARGLTLAVDGNQSVVAPAGGRILFAGPFRSYGNIVIIDHGRGWTSVVTDIERLDVRSNTAVRSGDRLGRTGPSDARVGVELRHNGRPVEIAPLLRFG
jgi:septal ring factor EnvC (AmiA/AmiB activator)